MTADEIIEVYERLFDRQQAVIDGYEKIVA